MEMIIPNTNHKTTKLSPIVCFIMFLYLGVIVNCSNGSITNKENSETKTVNEKNIDTNSMFAIADSIPDFKFDTVEGVSIPLFFDEYKIDTGYYISDHSGESSHYIYTYSSLIVPSDVVTFEFCRDDQALKIRRSTQPLKMINQLNLE
ncbi:MAG: hypothetical protein GC181_10970 [Bacteroidetes bacterium]|nr:hypothetical protein [Bacteroidota bacterium]